MTGYRSGTFPQWHNYRISYEFKQNLIKFITTPDWDSSIEPNYFRKNSERKEYFVVKRFENGEKRTNFPTEVYRSYGEPLPYLKILKTIVISYPEGEPCIINLYPHIKELQLLNKIFSEVNNPDTYFLDPIRHHVACNWCKCILCINHSNSNRFSKDSNQILPCFLDPKNYKIVE